MTSTTDARGRARILAGRTVLDRAPPHDEARLRSILRESAAAPVRW